jgi:RimJ/RimL family protein N-acetyltransferase
MPTAEILEKTIRLTSLVEASDVDFEWMLGAKPAADRGLTLPPGGIDDPIVLGHVRNIARRLHEANCNACWMIVDAAEVVGLCGYKRPPSNGQTEIGYGIAASRRELGHATRAVAAMLRAADADPGVEVVLAETTSSNIASARVLEKNAFERTGTRSDPEDGELVMWRRPVAPSR